LVQLPAMIVFYICWGTCQVPKPSMSSKFLHHGTDPTSCLSHNLSLFWNYDGNTLNWSTMNGRRIKILQFTWSSSHSLSETVPDTVIMQICLSLTLYGCHQTKAVANRSLLPTWIKCPLWYNEYSQLSAIGRPVLFRKNAIGG